MTTAAATDLDGAAAPAIAASQGWDGGAAQGADQRGSNQGGEVVTRIGDAAMMATEWEGCDGV